MTRAKQLAESCHTTVREMTTEGEEIDAIERAITLALKEAAQIAMTDETVARLGGEAGPPLDDTRIRMLWAVLKIARDRIEAMYTEEETT